MSFPKYRAAGIIDGADWDDFVLNMVAHSLRHVLAGADPIITPLDARAIALTTHGDVVFSGAGNLLTRLPAGNVGDILQSGGAGMDLSWVAPAGLVPHEATHVLGGGDDIDSALDARAIALTAHGEIVYRAAAANTLAPLAVGAAGQALLTQGAGVNPLWGAPAPAAHAASHMDGGADELDVSDLAGAVGAAGEIPETDGAAVTWVDPDGRYAPAAHEATHVQGGADDIDAALDARAVALANQGEIVYHAAGANTLAALAVGVAGQALLSGGPAANVSWGAPAPAAHKNTHVTGGGDAFAGGDLLDATARVAVNRNNGAVVGTRRELSFIEGANVTIGVVDDPANEEVEVTITAAGATATAWIKHFYPASNPDSNYGTYATQIMPDSEDTLIRQTFMMPEEIATVEYAYIIVIPEATGDLRRSVATNFAQSCVETYQTHTDSIAAGQVGVTIDVLECLDFSAALTGALGLDMVGIEFSRLATNVLDDINADVHYLGILIIGAA